MTSSTRLFPITRNALFEFLLIVLGVLVALAVDSWQQERHEKERLRGHLFSLVGEIDQNLFTIEIIRDGVLPRKIDRLGRFIEMLEGAESAPVLDHTFVRELAASTTDAKLWFTRNSYDALLSSGGFKYLNDIELEAYLSGAFNSADTLLQQPLQSRGEYPGTIIGLIPAGIMTEAHPMRGYVRNDEVAPRYDSAVDYSRLSQTLFENRDRMIRMARNEMAYAAGTWYAVTRMMHDFKFVRSEIIGHPLLQGVEIEPVLKLPDSD